MTSFFTTRRLSAIAPVVRVWILTAVLAVAGVIIGQLRDPWWSEQSLPVTIDWWMLAPAFFVAEIFVIHYQFRREQYFFTLVELPLALGLFFSGWWAVIIARLLGGGL